MEKQKQKIWKNNLNKFKKANKDGIKDVVDKLFLTHTQMV